MAILSGYNVAQSGPLSFSSSLWPPSSLFLLLYLFGCPTRSEPPKDFHWTRAVGDEPEDAKVVAASFVHCETPPFVVEEAHDGCNDGGARTQVDDHLWRPT